MAVLTHVGSRRGSTAAGRIRSALREMRRSGYHLHSLTDGARRIGQRPERRGARAKGNFTKRLLRLTQAAAKLFLLTMKILRG